VICEFRLFAGDSMINCLKLIKDNL